MLLMSSRVPARKKEGGRVKVRTTETAQTRLDDLSHRTTDPDDILEPQAPTLLATRVASCLDFATISCATSSALTPASSDPSRQPVWRGFRIV